jgi:hypothetical protein
MSLMSRLSPAGKVPPDVQRPASQLHSDLIDLVLVDDGAEDGTRDYVNCDVPAAGSLIKDPFDMRKSLPPSFLSAPSDFLVTCCTRTIQFHAARTVSGGAAAGQRL